MQRLIQLFIQGCATTENSRTPHTDDAPTEISEFTPVQKTEDSLAKKLKQLGELKEEFYVIKSLVKGKKEKEEKENKKTSISKDLKIVVPIEIEEIKAASTPDPIDPTEKLIEACIHQAQQDLRRDIAILKNEAKSTAEHFEMSVTAIRVTEKLDTMIHDIHLIITNRLVTKEVLPNKVADGLELVVELVPGKPILDGLLKFTKFVNILLKESKEKSDEELFKKIHSGINATIELLNAEFQCLDTAKKQLEQIYKTQEVVKAAANNTEEVEEQRRPAFGR